MENIKPLKNNKQIRLDLSKQEYIKLKQNMQTVFIFF